MLPAADHIQQTHAGGSAIQPIDTLWKVISLLQYFEGPDTQALVFQEDIPHAQHEYRARGGINIQSALTRTISFFLGSTMWMAQARQGSKE